ncbi:MAG: hypothetical protein MI922_24470, partial [Bacteroidales bacterium]|nr:hypothetical protein [Bacteroidales bacterium]
RELYRDFIIRKKLEKKKPYFTQSKAGRRIFIGFHVTFILLGLAMVILPVVNILLSSHINEHYILVTSITFIGSVGIGFSMVWKLGHALTRFLITHKPC